VSIWSNLSTKVDIVSYSVCSWQAFPGLIIAW
jgi:hypothetical protein